VREKELIKAANGVFGIPVENIHIVNHLQMPDNPKQHWDPDLVANTIEDTMFQKTSPGFHSIDSSSSLTTKNCAKIAILTFDEGGVSGHLNHVDTYRGVKHLLRRHDQSQIHKQRLLQHVQMHVEIRGYELQTIYFPLRKYLPPLDWMIVFIMSILILPCWRWCYSRFQYTSSPFSNLLICYCFQPLQVWRAMEAHSSQFVWYRKLSVLWSRYTYVNTWKEIVLEENNTPSI